MPTGSGTRIADRGGSLFAESVPERPFRLCRRRRSPVGPAPWIRHPFSRSGEYLHAFCTLFISPGPASISGRHRSTINF